jgi:exosome complex component RRP4
MTETRQIVVPGELVASADEFRPGQNTYQEGNDIYALRLGVKSVRGSSVNVISLSGRYEPARGDMVIGTVAEAGPSNWYINIGAANDVGMHVNDVPWRVEFGETARYLAVGDTVLLKIVHVDELKKAQVSMKDRQCRKLTGGLILEVSPTKVPRIVGRNGSMIGLIKDATNVRLFVGQNGVVWMDGEPEDVQLALEALRKVEAEAHTTGLTDRMKEWLEERRPSASRPQRAPEEEPEEMRSEPRPRERRERREPREHRGERDERRREYRPPREEEGERRPRRFEGGRGGYGEPSFRGEEERPRRRFEDREERPRRSFEETRRETDEPEPGAERPRRRFEEEERPRRRAFDETRGSGRSREGDGESWERPRRSFSDEDRRDRAPPPARRFDEDEDERPARRPARDDDEAYGQREERGGGAGGRRRRRGGRGRGSRGGQGRREE